MITCLDGGLKWVQKSKMLTTNEGRWRAHINVTLKLKEDTIWRTRHRHRCNWYQYPNLGPKTASEAEEKRPKDEKASKRMGGCRARLQRRYQEPLSIEQLK